MAFQSQVQLYTAPGVAGDFASADPYASVVTGPNAFIAGLSGLYVGRFAWIDADGVSLNNAGVGAPQGFVGRNQQALITTYMDESTMLIPTGFMSTIFNQGAFWAKTLSNATRGQKVYASLSTGQVRVADAGSIIQTFDGTATFATNVMTVATVVSGTLAVNDVITSSGVTTGTYITAQLTGTPGGVGTYQLSTSPGTITPAQAITATDYVETNFYCDLTASANEVIQMSTWG